MVLFSAYTGLDDFISRKLLTNYGKLAMYTEVHAVSL